MSWVYIKSEPRLWTVGHYDPAGKWHPDSDHADREYAAKRCAFLNGIQDGLGKLEQLSRAVGVLRDWIADHTPGQDHSRLFADVELP